MTDNIVAHSDYFSFDASFVIMRVPSLFAALSVFSVVWCAPLPSWRSAIVAKVLGPELDEIRGHLQIVPEIRQSMDEVNKVVHDIRALLDKITSFDKKSFFRSL